MAEALFIVDVRSHMPNLGVCWDVPWWYVIVTFASTRSFCCGDESRRAVVFAANHFQEKLLHAK
jgi:hypothetical protein